MGLVCVYVMITWLLQGEQLLPKPLTPEPTLRLLPQLLLLLLRRRTTLQPLPGRQAPLERPVTTPLAQVTPTWPPPLWWLQPGRGFRHSLEETTAGKSRTTALQMWPENGSSGHAYCCTWCRFRLLCTRRLIPLSKNAIHYLSAMLDFWRNRICNRHQKREISAFLSCHNFL